MADKSPAGAAAVLIRPKKSTDTLPRESLAAMLAEFGPPLEPRPRAQPDRVGYTNGDGAGDSTLTHSENRDLCPFCKDPLPSTPSRTLKAMIRTWQQRRQSGGALRATDTLSVCQRHRDEHTVIPEGLKRGWPLRLDLKELRRRITSPKQPYMDLMRDRLLRPRESDWFQDACCRREDAGKGASASTHQIDNFDTHQTG